MCLVDDNALVANVTGGTSPLVSNLPPRDDWFDADSPVQASSVDLHIGKVFLPGKAGKAEGSQDCPLDLYALEPGQTAVVSTLEELHLPGDIAAIGFPPSRVSVQGLLMTNPGHVDPGYVGPMRFTVINMGKADYVLRRNEPIVTVLFINLSRSVKKNWLERRNGKPGGPPTQKDLNVLSADFLDVKARAELSAKTEVENAGIKLRAHEKWIAGIGAVGLIVSYWFSGLQDMKIKVAELEKSLSVAHVQQQMTDIDRRLKLVEQNQTPSSAPETPNPKKPSTK